MPSLPDPADLEALKAFDTPTVCNALELVAPARRATGFIRRPLIAPFPELKPVVAFARTALIRSREPHPRSRAEATELRLGYYAHVAAQPLPSIAVIQDIDGPDCGFGAFWGEVQSNVHKGLLTVSCSKSRAISSFTCFTSAGRSGAYCTRSPGSSKLRAFGVGVRR